MAISPAFSSLVQDLRGYVSQSNDAQTAICKSYEVDDTDLAIVRLVAAQEDMRMKDIGAAIGMKLSSLTGTVDALEALKLVKRRNDKADRRVVFVRLAPRGQSLLGALEETFANQAETLSTALTPEELLIVEKAFHLMKKHIHPQTP